MSDETVNLLREIRDLLVPVAEVAKPQYEAILQERHARAIKAAIEIVGRSPKQLQAARLMDGSLTQGEIRSRTAFDAGNFSKFVKKLRDAGALREAGGKLSLLVPPNMIPWPNSGGNDDR